MYELYCGLNNKLDLNINELEFFIKLYIKYNANMTFSVYYDIYADMMKRNDFMFNIDSIFNENILKLLINTKQ